MKSDDKGTMKLSVIFGGMAPRLSRQLAGCGIPHRHVTLRRERMKHRIYVASSWRNTLQPTVVSELRDAGHEVYDFRNPAPGNTGFAWSQVDPEWQWWETRRYIERLGHTIAQDGFKLDFDAMKWATAGVLVLPCGRSAHIEAGWLLGAGKPVVVYIPEPCEPELMYLLAGQAALTDSLDEVLKILSATPAANDSVSQEYGDIDPYPLPSDSFVVDGCRSVEIVAVKKERLAALEEVVRAADRLRGGSSAALDMTKEWHGGLCSCRKCKVRDELGLSIEDCDSKRAALGKIGGE